MKKLILILTIIFACSLCVCAHPGSLDENGGHWDHSTGEYHYHDGTNQDNNPTGDSDSYNYYYENHKTDKPQPTAESQKLNFFNSPFAAPFWFSLSWISIAAFSFIDYQYQKKYKTLILFSLVMATLTSIVIFAMLISIFFFGDYDELSTVIISAICANIIFRVKTDFSKTKLIISMLLTFMLGIFTHILLQKQFISELIVIYAMFAVIGYLLLDKFLKQKSKGLTKYKSSSDTPTVLEQTPKPPSNLTKSTVSKEKENSTPPDQEKTTTVETITYPANNNAELEKLFIEHWEQRQAAKVKPKPIYSSSLVSKPTVDDDEAQRLDSLLLYVDELEKSRTKYKNNKKK